jgi:hypothetical protein
VRDPLFTCANALKQATAIVGVYFRNQGENERNFYFLPFSVARLHAVNAVGSRFIYEDSGQVPLPFLKENPLND